MTSPSPPPALDGLPFVDEHAVDTLAAPPDVWRSVVATFGHQSAGTAQYARLVGADPVDASGTFPEVGATVAGFRVADVHPETMLLLTGRHRFSTYALTVLVDAHEGGTRVRALTHATFPGVLGTAYRAIVITSGAHRAITRRLLRGVVERASR